MPFPVLDTGPAFHVAFKWADGAQFAINTLSFNVDSAGSASDLAAALDAHFTAAMTPDQVDSAHVVEYGITPYDGVSSATPFATTHIDGHTGGPWVPQVAQCVSLYSGAASRRARGRVYLPFVAEGAITDGFTTSGSDVTATAAWNAFLLAMAVAGFTPIVASTITHHTHTTHNPDGSVTRGIPVGGALLPTSFVIERCLMRPKLATQRRRQARL